METKEAFKECPQCGVPNFLHTTYCGWENAGFLAIPGVTTNLMLTSSDKEANWKFWKTLFVPTPALPNTEPKTGVQLIEQERLEQIEKHGRTQTHDIVENTFNQLTDAAMMLLMEDRRKMNKPSNWDKEIWLKMINKPYKERLIIAGALIAAEIDRIIYNESDTIEVAEDFIKEICRVKYENEITQTGTSNQ